jgi:glycerol kinase
VKDSHGLIFVPAFVGLGAPHWDPHASGLIIGLQRNTEKGHIARAALEGIAFQVADVLDAIDSDSGQPFQELRVDGAACSNNLMMQFQADILGIPVVRPEFVETTALGAAYLAGLASGFWGGPTEIWSHRKNDTRFEPQMNRDEAAQLRGKWKKALERAKLWSEEGDGSR